MEYEERSENVLRYDRRVAVRPAAGRLLARLSVKLLTEMGKGNAVTLLPLGVKLSTKWMPRNAQKRMLRRRSFGSVNGVWG